MIDATHGIMSIVVQTGETQYFTGHIYQAPDSEKYTLITRWDTDKRFITLLAPEQAQRVAATLRANSQGVRYMVVEERYL
jgi:hypothetical protein